MYNSIEKHLDQIEKRMQRDGVSEDAIAFVMKQINPEQLLVSLGIRCTPRRYRDKYIIGWCPDHFQFTNRQQSHPKWYFDVDTGTTYCYTESRRSNILEIIKNILKVDDDSAMEILKGKKEIIIPSDYVLKQQRVAMHWLF